MSDEPYDPHEATEEGVRRLLADARHTAPVPPDVAARLDGVLADLRAELAADHAAAPQATRTAVVVPIGSRRPWSLTRRLTTGLVAAAAVVVAGVALPTLTGGLGGSNDSASTSADSPKPEESLTRDQSESAPQSPSASQFSGSTGGDSSGSAQMAAVPTVSPERFKRDARQARPQAVASYDASGPVCGTLPAGAVVPVRYEDRDGYLVFGETASARQQVALYLCPQGELVRRAEIPAR